MSVLGQTVEVQSQLLLNLRLCPLVSCDSQCAEVTPTFNFVLSLY